MSLGPGGLQGSGWQKGGARLHGRFGSVEAVRRGSAALRVESLKLSYTANSQRLTGSLVCVNEGPTTGGGEQKGAAISRARTTALLDWELASECVALEIALVQEEKVGIAIRSVLWRGRGLVATTMGTRCWSATKEVAMAPPKATKKISSDGQAHECLSVGFKHVTSLLMDDGIGATPEMRARATCVLNCIANQYGNGKAIPHIGSIFFGGGGRR